MDLEEINEFNTFLAEIIDMFDDDVQEIINKVNKVNVSELSESEQKKLISLKLKIDADKFKIKQDFHIQLTKILPSVKVIRYFKLEREFRKKMLNRLKHQRKGPHHNRGRRN